MIKMIFTLLFSGFAFVVFGQGPSVSVKKEKLLVDDNPVCIIDKKKKGLIGSPSFEIKTLDEKPLGKMQYMETTLPISGNTSWYNLVFEGIQDSVQLNIADFRTFNKSTFLQYDEALGKIIVDYALLKDNNINKEGFEKLKKDFGTDYSKTYAEKNEKEKYCLAQVKAVAKSNATEGVTVAFVSKNEVSKSKTILTYDIMQGEKKLGSIVAEGSAKGAKEEDAEYDYSSGMFSMDGASPLNYDIKNEEGCVIARYIGEQKTMGTWRDRVEIKSGDIKKHNPNGVKSRLDYMQGIANYLVKKRYL